MDAFLEKMAYASLYTRNTSGLHPSLRGLGANPTLTPEAAMQSAIQAYGAYHLNSRDFQNSGWLASAAAEIAAGQFDMSVWASTCQGLSAPNLNLLQTASGIGLSAAATTTGILASSSVALIPAAAVPVVGWVIAGVGAVIALISTIFQHHAQAVKRDNTFSCSALAAVNNAFQVIAQGVQSGNILPADAAGAITQIYSEFMSAGGASGSASGPGSVPSGGTAINDSPYCNSNCEMSVILFGMVLYWQAQYQALAAQQSAEAQQAAAVSTPSGVSTQTTATVVPSTTPTPSTSPSSVSSSMVVPAAIVAPAASGVSAVPAWAWLLLAAVGAWAVA